MQNNQMYGCQRDIINIKFTFSNSLQTDPKTAPNGLQRIPTDPADPSGPQQTPKDPNGPQRTPNVGFDIKSLKEFIKCIPSILFTAQMQGMLGL